MCRSALTGALLAIGATLPSAAWAAWPTGTLFDPTVNYPAVTVDVTPEGFQALTGAIPALLPSQIDIPDQHLYDCDEECISWPWGGQDCWCNYEYTVDVQNGWVSIALSNVLLTPQNASLALSATATISVNSAPDPMTLDVNAKLLGITVVDDTCMVHADPFPTDISTTIYLSIVQGPDGPVLDAEIAPIEWDLGLETEDLHLEDCTVGDVLDFFDDIGIDIVGFIIDQLYDTLDDQIQGLIGDLEPMIEEAFASATIEETVSLGETELTISAYPASIDIVPEGMRMTLAGAFSADRAACVAPYADPGSLETPGILPALATAPAGVTTPYHAGVMITDDWVNNGLYTAWYAGLLCYTLDESMGPINSTILTILSKDAYEELFPETRPLEIVTRPALAPVLYPTGDHDLNVEIRELGLDLYAELDYRMTRMLGTKLETDVGVDLVFDGNTGDMVVDVALDAEQIAFTVEYNELAPGYDGEIEGAFAGLFDTIVGPILGPMLESLAFALPSLNGFGLQSLEYAAAGPSEDYLALYALVGTVPYTGASCEDGCSSGCSGGCSSGSVQGWLFVAALPVLAALARRRRSAP